jgi:hypothetical protein
MPGSRTSRPGSGRYPSTTRGRDEFHRDDSGPTSGSGEGALRNGPVTCPVGACIVTSMQPTSSSCLISSARLQGACETVREGTGSHGGGGEGGWKVQDDGGQQHGMRQLRGNDASMRARILADSRAHVVGNASSRSIGNVSVLVRCRCVGFLCPSGLCVCVCVCVCVHVSFIDNQ